MSSFVPDLRYALRQPRRNPAFALGTVATLGLGIGATAAVFSAAEAVVSRPLPFPEPDRVVGRMIEVNETSVRVAGVLPPEFETPATGADLWFPVVFTEQARQSRRSHPWQVFGTRVLLSMIFGIGPLDPPSFVLAPRIILAAGVLAGLVPALRAARIDPMEALRHV